MTQPTVVFFGPDELGSPKVFLRTLLYSTSKRGHIVESMWVKLRHAEASQLFNIWVYGDSALVRGSGLHVAENGVVCNHHFLLPYGAKYDFAPGEHRVEIYASLVKGSKELLLSQITLSLTEGDAAGLKWSTSGVYFDWAPDSRKYEPHIHVRPDAT